MTRLPQQLASLCATGVGTLFAAASLSCGPGELTQDVEELPGDPYCLVLAGTWGHYEDGSKLLIADWDKNYVLGGCVCATLEEVLAGERDEDMNAAGLERCQDFAATRDFAYDECLEDYEAGDWLGSQVPAGPGSGWEPLVPPDLHCAGS